MVPFSKNPSFKWFMKRLVYWGDILVLITVPMVWRKCQLVKLKLFWVRMKWMIHAISWGCNFLVCVIDISGRQLCLHGVVLMYRLVTSMVSSMAFLEGSWYYRSCWENLFSLLENLLFEWQMVIWCFLGIVLRWGYCTWICWVCQGYLVCEFLGSYKMCRGGRVGNFLEQFFLKLIWKEFDHCSQFKNNCWCEVFPKFL